MSRIVYQVLSRHIAVVRQRTLLRETAKWYWFKSLVQPDGEKEFKDRVVLFPTFEEAKADLIAKKRRKIGQVELELGHAKEQLAKAEVLTMAMPDYTDDEILAKPLKL